MGLATDNKLIFSLEKKKNNKSLLSVLPMGGEEEWFYS